VAAVARPGFYQDLNAHFDKTVGNCRHQCHPAFALLDFFGDAQAYRHQYHSNAVRPVFVKMLTGWFGYLKSRFAPAKGRKPQKAA